MANPITLEQLNAKIDEINTKIDVFTADMKAALARLETKGVTKTTTAKTKKQTNVEPEGERFHRNYMAWFRAFYAKDPEGALALAPVSYKDDIEDYRNTADEKYQKKSKDAKLSAEASYLWKSFSKDVKDQIKIAYNQAKEEHEKKQLEPATTEHKPADDQDADAEDIPVQRKTTTGKRQVVVE